MEEKTTFTSKPNLLVAEDSLINRKLLELQFQQRKINAEFVEDGSEVIQKLKGSNQFNLLLLDLEMPIMNGYETTINIRTQLKSDIPIIAMSGYSDLQEKDKCLAMGMNHYLSKPIDMEILYTLINELTNEGCESDKELKDGKKQLFSHIDLTYFRTMSGGRPEFELNIFQMFIEDIPIQLQEMSEALIDKSYKLAAQIIHKMKSSLLMIGMNQIEPIIKEIEQNLIDEKFNPQFHQIGRAHV